MYREILPIISNLLDKPQSPIILILGLRQTGKTTLAKTAVAKRPFQLFNFDLASDQADFLNQNRHSLDLFATRYKDQIILIDEVQKLPEATGIIKHLYDNYGLKFIVTGSSELKIRSSFGDSLAGRTRIFNLYPLSLRELLVQKETMLPSDKVPFEASQNLLQKNLIFGSLPALQNIDSDEWQPYLRDFTETLLAKDVLEVANIRNSTKIRALARLLALQVGQLVNVNELAMLTELSRSTIYNYLDILEQLSLIKRSYPLSTNERAAISAKFKVYFTDLGPRNYLAGSFAGLPERMDSGALLENWAFMSFKRCLEYAGGQYSLGFFRSASGSELDLVVKTGVTERLFEVKKSDRFAKKKSSVITYLTLSGVYEVENMVF